MEAKLLRMPSSYATITEQELCYLDGGDMTEEQIQVCAAVISVFITSVMLMPNVYQYMLTPVTNAIGSFFKNLFGSKS
jgi:hypothetical protein